ncbi:DM13 domain-containing protein [Vibrio maerlii]|uniref:DM13 domain-containing protein n=1 Tax=Vibrio maerlii TaxID=2231648 RepID=UPI000E3D9B9B|nr:DM13 domain-containing protein [Vibrio maerlii]
MKKLMLLISHSAMLLVGFALGVYALPILIQPESPDQQSVASVQQSAMFSGQFSKERADSDFLHWGEGEISVSQGMVAFEGELAPGPDYKLYLSPTYIETEADFATHKDSMVNIGDVKTFDRFTLEVPSSVDVTQYSSVIIWCETFGEYITSTQYQKI